MPPIYFEVERDALKAQTPGGRYWCLAELHIQRDPYEPSIGVVVLADGGQFNVPDSVYEQAEKLMKDVLKPRHDAEADTNTLPVAYFYDLTGNQRPRP